jgi:uncharacterized protein (TIGR03435 family)
MRCLVWLTLAAACAAGQGRPAFEVASVKPCATADRTGGRGASALPEEGRLEVNCQTLGSLIRMAYLQYATGEADSPLPSLRQMKQPLPGAPAWVESDRYTIEAKAEKPETLAVMRGPLLQALLEDRFGLRLHRDIREVPVYALTVAKGGPKLAPAESGRCGGPAQRPCGAIVPNRDGTLTGYGIAMAALCRELSRVLDKDVVDRTGIAEPFDLHMELAPQDGLAGIMLNGEPWYKPDPSAPATDPQGNSVFPAVLKLGLKLEPSKAQAQFLIVDRVERPGAN